MVRRERGDSSSCIVGFMGEGEGASGVARAITPGRGWAINLFRV